jgi:hypothetical protein
MEGNMSIGFIFWLLMILWLVFGAYVYRGQFGVPLAWGGNLLFFVLLFLLGWRVFGWPIVG